MSGRKINALELKIHQAALAHPKKTLTQKELDDLAPDAAARLQALNFLLGTGMLKAMADAKGRTSFRVVMKHELEVKKDMTGEETMVLSHIQASGNEGIWTKHLKSKTELHQTILDRCLKSLVQKQLVKAVKSVKHPTRKIYMLSHLTPSVEMTGGPWYTDNELDTEFIKLLTTACLHFITDRTFNKKKPDSLPTPSTSSYPSAREVQTFLSKSKITETPLDLEHVEMLLRVLILDGEVEKIPAFGAAMWDSAGINDDEASEDEDEGSESEDEDKKKKKKRKTQSKEKNKDKDKKKSKKRTKEEDNSDEEMVLLVEEDEDEGSKKKTSKKRKKDESDSDSDDESDSDDGKKKRSKSRSKSKSKSKKRKVKEEDRDETMDSDDDDERTKKRAKSKSKSKGKKRARSSSPSSSSSSSSESDSHSKSRSKSRSKSKSRTKKRPRARSPSTSPAPYNTDFDNDVSVHVYRAIHQERLNTKLGWSEAPCGRCPVFDFCKDKGPVNAGECSYYEEWLGAPSGAAGVGGGGDD